MDSGFSNMLENTRKYFQGIPNDAAAAAAAAQLHFAPPLPPSHHLHHNGGGSGRTPMSTSSSSSSSEPSSAVATDRFAAYHHPHLQRYNYQPYTSPGHYPRTAVDPKPAAFQHHHFQPPSLQQYHHHQLPPSSSSSSSSSSSPYKSPFQLQPPPPPPPPTVKPPQPPLAQSPFKPAAARSSPPVGKQYSPAKPSPYAVVSKPSPYAVVPKPSTTTAPQPAQSPFTVPKEQLAAGLQQPSVPETPPPTPHSSHYYNRTTHSSSSSSSSSSSQQQQQAIDRDYSRFKPIQTPPPPQPNRFQTLERPKSEVPTGPQSSHLAIRYDPKLEQPRSGVRAVPIAQAKQPSSFAATSHDINRVIVQKPEPRYHQQPQQQQHSLNHRSSDDHHHHHKRPASVQPSYLDSRPFQIKPYDGGSNNSNGSSSSSGSGSGQSSTYHRPFAVAPPTALPTSSQSSSAVVVPGMDHRWTVFGRQDARTPAFLQQPPSSATSAAAAVINGYHHHRGLPPSSSSLPVVVSQHLQHQSSSMSSRQPQQQHYPLNLHKLTPPARPATAAGQLQQVQVKGGPENSTSAASTKLRFEMKRESPLDLSVKTVCRSADSTDDRLNPFGHDIPKVNFKPDFNVCRGTTASSMSATGPTVQPAPPTVVVVGGQQPQLNATAPTYHQMQAPPLSLPPPSPLPPPPAVVSPQHQLQQQQQPLSSSSALPTPLPPVVHHQGPPLLQLSPADEAWRAAIDRQIEQKFSTYTSAKKHPHLHDHPLQQLQHPQLPPVLQPQQQPQQQQQQPQQQQQGPGQADKRVLEMLKQNIEARDQSSRPQIAEAPSTPAMVFSTPIRKEPSTTPLKKTDYYMAERTAVTPFPKKIDYYMDRAYCNAPRIRTKAERKQISAEGSSSGTRMSSPMAAATAISPHPFLPSNNGSPQTKQEQIPLTQTESVVDVKVDIKRDPSPIKDPEPCLLNKEDVEKDDDEEFWMNTCNSFVVQLAETQEKKKVKTPVKRKLPKEQLPQPPKRKYTKRIKVEPVSESEQDNKLPEFKEDLIKKRTEEVKSEKSAQEKITLGDKPEKMESLDMDKENKTKEIDQEKTTDDKEKEDDKEPSKVKPKRKRLFKLKFPKPLLVTKVKKIKKDDKKELKMKKETKKEEKKELKKSEKKETNKKDILLQKTEKKELAAAAKEEKKGLKKEEKRDLKKDPQNNKKDLNNKKENKKTEVTRKKGTAEKENATRRSAAAAAAINEVASKFNPRQSLRRKNSLKDYTFAFDELLDDAFAHFETDDIPVKAATAVVVKKPKEKDNSESTRMNLRSRSRPLLVKQEPLLASKKKGNAKNKNIPKRRRKKSLGEKSTLPAAATADNWKDELYKFKRSLRLPSKLISVVSPPSDVGPDQVSLTSIMNIPPLLKPAKVPKVAKSTSQSHATTTAAAAVSMTVAAVGKNKTKRLGHLFGRRDVFKGRHLLKREKIVSAEKLMQRNLRKRRQQEDEGKKGCAGEEATADLPDDEDINVEIDEDDDDDNSKNGRKQPTRMLFKRKFMRKKFRSGFDYIKKKKKKEPASEKKPSVSVPTATTSVPSLKCAPRFVSEIQADIKVWIVNKGHGETVLHRAARLGVKDVVGFCIEKLEYAPSVADNAGYTPLHEACSQGHYHIAKLLLQFGADVSASAQGGIRPLHEAVENGDVHLVRLLLGYGADPHLATYSGQSPLSLASDKQTRMLLEHHVNDIQGYGNASVWNFDETTLNGEPEDVDKLLWCSPPQSSSADDGPSFEFEFADQSLPDVYKLPADADAAATGADADDWVLFSDVSAALSVKTADALAKLLDDENAVTAVPLDRFNERAMPRKTLGRQPVDKTAAVNKAAVEQSTTKDADENAGGATGENASAAAGEQILLVRYDHKLKQLLGVDAYSVS